MTNNGNSLKGETKNEKITKQSLALLPRMHFSHGKIIAVTR